MTTALSLLRLGAPVGLLGLGAPELIVALILLLVISGTMAAPAPRAVRDTGRFTSAEIGFAALLIALLLAAVVILRRR